MCDANYTFSHIDIGVYGSQSDEGVLWNFEVGKRLFNNQLDLPKDSPLPGTILKFQYIIVGDAAFPLKNCLMRPYPSIFMFILSSKSYNFLNFRKLSTKRMRNF